MANAEKVDMRDGGRVATSVSSGSPGVSGSSGSTGSTGTTGSTLRVRIGAAEWDVATGRNPHRSGDVKEVKKPFSHDKSDYAYKTISLNTISHSNTGSQSTQEKVVRVYTLPIQALERRFVNWLKASLRTIFPTDGRRAMTGLKGGLMVGMALGCIALFVFHQFGFVTGQVQQTTTHVQSQDTVPVSAAMAVKMLSLPGFHVYDVNYGTYPSVTQAQVEMKKLSKHGIDTVILKDGEYQLLANLTVEKSDADTLANAHSSLGANESKLTQSARMIAVLGVSDKQVVDSTQRFVAASLSAILATTAWSNDHGRVSDAATAISSAIQAYPGDSVLAQTGVGHEFSILQTSLTSMQRDVKQGNLQHAASDSLSALTGLMDLHGIDTAA